MTNLVFVYGTLKRGYGNNRLLKDAVYTGTDELPGFEMYYSYGEGSFPVIKRNGNGSVVGEVYDLSGCPHALGWLDSLEGHPEWYNRQVHETVSGVKVQTYVGLDFDFDKMDLVPQSADGKYIWSR